MRNKNYRTDSCLDIARTYDCAGGLGGRIEDGGRNRYRAIWMALMGAALLLSAGPAFGQFTVEPMKLELQVTPGKIVKSLVRIRNFDPNEIHTIDLTVVELTQSQDGEWAIVEPNDPNSPYDVSKLSSCSSWIRIENSSVTLDPLQVLPLELTLRIPRGIRGFYTAGIIASIRPRPGMTDVVVTVRFLVPIVVEIEGRPVRPQVQATDVGMEFVPASESAYASMRIENNGESFSRLKPLVRIWSFAGGHWRVITTTEFPETGIIPGAKLNLKTGIQKSLPSGKYKVAGQLYVDGRPTKRVEREIDFAGDPKLNRVAADAPLELDPTNMTIDGLPGSTRTGTIKVFNASNETVNIQAALALPDVLKNTVVDEVRGQDLDCTGWLKIVPDRFTLQGEGGRQNLQIIAMMPDPAATYPCYYSLLSLWATYPDGQRAGTTTAPICVRNSNIVAQPEAQGLRVDIQDLGQSNYLIAAKFGNFKTIHFAPITVKAAVVMTTGAAGDTGIPRASIFLSGDPGIMLPFETRQFSGVMDFSVIPADTYLLVGRLEYAPGQFARSQKLIQVSIEGEQRIVRTIGTQIELGENVEVKW